MDRVLRASFEGVQAAYAELGEEFELAFREMLVFDALICNTDRRYGNFGFLVDARSNRIVAPAPLFDHGNSLFHQAYGQDWESDEALGAYASSLQPRVYDDFVGTAKAWMTDANRAQVRRLLEFEFKKGGRYRLDERRLRRIEAQVRNRARQLLDR